MLRLEIIFGSRGVQPIIGWAAHQKIQPGFPSCLKFLVVIIIVIVILVIGLSSSHSLEPKVLRKSSLGSELLAIDQTSAADCQWPAGTNVSLSIISRL